MASGLSTRFGSNKLLAPFDGQPLLCRAFAATDTPQLSARIVVTRSAQVQALCKAQGVPVLLHALPGRNDTVRLGLSALLAQHPELTGCMFLPGDQPLLRRATVDQLLTAFAQTQKETERGHLKARFEVTPQKPGVVSRFTLRQPPVRFWGDSYRAFLASSTTAAKAAGSWMAISDRLLRFISMPAFFTPFMNRE